MFITRYLSRQAVRVGLTCLFAVGALQGTAAAAQQPPPQAPAQNPPAVPPSATPQADPAAQAAAPPAPAPGAAPVPAPPVPGTVACPVPVPPATVPARAFTASAGMIFLQVIPTRMGDFDRFLAYVRDALAKTTNPTVRKQAEGWSFHRTVEAGPNGDALYLFIFDPAVPCVDYALSPILAEAYPDPAQLLEIWKLYQTSVRPNGSTLLTLVPAPVVPLTPPLTPPTTTTLPGAKPSPPSAGPETTPPSPGAPPPPPGSGTPPAGGTSPATPPAKGGTSPTAPPAGR